MGMFDSLYDSERNEWQTKAFGCVLDRYTIGDTIPGAPVIDFQVEVLGGDGPFIDSWATVRAGVLTAVPADRDEALPLMDYGGHMILPGGDVRRSREM